MESSQNREKSGVKKRPEIAVLLAWLVPGLGHFYIGKRLKSLIFGTTLIVAFFIGAFTSGRNVVSVEEHKIAFIGQIGSGIPALTTLILASAGDKPVIKDMRKIDPLFDIGLLYTVVAGLLNFIVTADAFEIALKEKKKSGN
ncbi:MAG: DUF6677 family protein [Planctomycetota bacterium]